MSENLPLILTGVGGLLTTIISGWTSWFFTRKKYDSEVDNTLIENMQKSLEFYKQLSDDNRKRLDEVLKKNAELEKEVAQLRAQMFNLMNSVCSDLSIKVKELGGELNIGSDNEDSSREEV